MMDFKYVSPQTGKTYIGDKHSKSMSLYNTA